MLLPRITQGKIVNRCLFGDLLNGRGLLDTAVEVGTHRGQFAKQLLDRWKGKMLWCNDPYQSGYDPTDQAAIGDRDLDARAAAARLEPHKDRIGWIATPSPDSASLFKDNTLDFVYIDGNHQKFAVSADLSAWWPKVKPGGLLAGHDVICPNEPNGGWEAEIQPVLLSFAVGHKLPVHLVVEQDGPWSYYLEKP